MQFALDAENIDTTPLDKTTLPQVSDFEEWVSAVLVGKKDNAQLTVRIVNENESTYLNAHYRHKNGPTNVLSFPAEYAKDIPIALIGDIVICAPIVISEAKTQNKDAFAHWAHLTIHGTLHLLGFDHTNERDANKMESCEIETLKRLGFTNPYV